MTKKHDHFNIYKEAFEKLTSLHAKNTQHMRNGRELTSSTSYKASTKLPQLTSNLMVKDWMLSLPRSSN